MLRHDNADLRLTEMGRVVGLVDDHRWKRFQTRRDAISRLRGILNETRIQGESLYRALRRPTTSWDQIVALDPSLAEHGFPIDVVSQIGIEAKYDGYIDRQIDQIERFRRLENKPIPADLEYRAIPQLRAEAREKFERIRPLSLGQAGRISGISPADIATLLIHLKRNRPELTAELSET